jgi:hypothetical protein
LFQHHPLYWILQVKPTRRPAKLKKSIFRLPEKVKHHCIPYFFMENFTGKTNMNLLENMVSCRCSLKSSHWQSLCSPSVAMRQPPGFFGMVKVTSRWCVSFQMERRYLGNGWREDVFVFNLGCVS